MKRFEIKAIAKVGESKQLIDVIVVAGDRHHGNLVTNCVESVEAYLGYCDCPRPWEVALVTVMTSDDETRPAHARGDFIKPVTGLISGMENVALINHQRTAQDWVEQMEKAKEEAVLSDKVLIDRELLREALIDLESGMMCNPSADTIHRLRALLSEQPPTSVKQSAPAGAAESEAWLQEWARDKFTFAGRYKGSVYGNTDWALARALHSAMLAASTEQEE